MIDGYVALVDVLGFRAFVSGDPSGERLDEYLGCLQAIAKSQRKKRELEFVVFSDSIVITTKEDSEDSLHAMVQTCSRLLGDMLKIQIPLRGAIARGRCFRQATTSNVFLAGRAIIDAYDFEQKQDWVGIMLSPSVVRANPDLDVQCKIPETDREMESFMANIRWAAILQQCSEIPFHSASPFDDTKYVGFAVVPGDGSCDVTRIRNALTRSQDAVERLKLLASDPAAQRKYKSTSRWLYGLNQKWDLIERWQERQKSAQS